MILWVVDSVDQIRMMWRRSETEQRRSWEIIGSIEKGVTWRECCWSACNVSIVGGCIARHWRLNVSEKEFSFWQVKKSCIGRSCSRVFDSCHASSSHASQAFQEFPPTIWVQSASTEHISVNNRLQRDTKCLNWTSFGWGTLQPFDWTFFHVSCFAFSWLSHIV